MADFKAQVEALGLTQPWDPPFWQGWDHQLVGRAFVKAKKRCIGDMDKGTGKTSWALSIFEDPEINHGDPGFTVLIFTNEKGMKRYQEDIKLFPEYANKVQLIYGGQKHQRQKRWRENPNARYFVCTYDSFLSDCGMRAGSGSRGGSEIIVPKWAMDKKSVDAVICDEFHRKFRRHKSQVFTMLKTLFSETEYFIPMSGSCVDKGPQDLWAALHLCDPKFWSSYWKYVYTWCEITTSYSGYRQISGPKEANMDNWRRIMSHWVFRVRAEEIEDMPEKSRTFLDIQLPPWQRALHDKILKDGFLEVGIEGDPDTKDFIFMRNQLSKNHKARLALICPKAVDPTLGVGQGIEDIADDAQESGANRYAVFTPFRAPIPHLASYLEQRGCRVWCLQGAIGLDEQERRLDAWRRSLESATPDQPSVILSTIQYAESWEIPVARYGYFLGEEYVREYNLQAEDRLRRLISVGLTQIQYARFKGTVQEDIITALMEKTENIGLMYDKWQNLEGQPTKR